VKRALISDIHGNLDALQSVLDDIRQQGITEIYCLGDVIGYGPNPVECLDLVRRKCTLCLLGNHDLAVLGQLDISSFSSAAAEAAQWTRENATEECLSFLRSLEPEGEREEIRWSRRIRVMERPTTEASERGRCWCTDLGTRGFAGSWNRCSVRSLGRDGALLIA
jgi:hypothetical protein